MQATTREKIKKSVRIKPTTTHHEKTWILSRFRVIIAICPCGVFLSTLELAEVIFSWNILIRELMNVTQGDFFKIAIMRRSSNSELHAGKKVAHTMEESRVFNFNKSHKSRAKPADYNKL